MKREIVNFFTEGGRKILTQEAVPVKHEDIGSDHVQQTIDDMLETLRSQGPGGVGIAANQIGSDLAIFIIDVRPPEDAKVEPFRLVAINPKIVEYSGEPVKSLNPEGCLSGVILKRHQWVLPRVTLRLRCAGQMSRARRMNRPLIVCMLGLSSTKQII